MIWHTTKHIDHRIIGDSDSESVHDIYIKYIFTTITQIQYINKIMKFIPVHEIHFCDH